MRRCAPVFSSEQDANAAIRWMPRENQLSIKRLARQGVERRRPSQYPLRFPCCRIARRAGKGYTREDRPMRSKLLVSTAALLAGMAMASAQTTPSGGRDSGPAAQSQGAPGGAAGQDRQAPQSSQGQRGQDTKGQAQQGQKDQMQPGQQKGQRDQAGQGKDSAQDKAQPQRTQGKRDQAGQGKDSAQDKAQPQSPSQTQESPKQGQSPQRQQGQQGQGAQPGQGAQGKTTQQGQTQQGQGGGSSATLTTEQQTKVREKVLTGGNVPRASNVNFSISVGTAVPRTVRVVGVPSTLVEFHPQWRGYRYFVVGDDMIIVDRNNRIVAVIAL